MASKRKNATIYENYATMAVNFVRTSSLALAKLTLGRGSRPPPPRIDAAAAATEMPAMVVLHQAVEPERHITKYLMEPDAGGATTIDDSATEYIRKIRETIRKEHNGQPSLTLIPPPPPNPMHKYAFR
ncbi:hypothetical protein Cni_G22370 [Canna indica]|uniref:Uncharacterized protein n=1 Tax=Canna indica TaxID=4628 RepID=A0AAQ3KRW2_9LILI|nr:hypothetical protein Cni_G22370 [Canna indica]